MIKPLRVSDDAMAQRTRMRKRFNCENRFISQCTPKVFLFLFLFFFANQESQYMIEKVLTLSVGFMELKVAPPARGFLSSHEEGHWFL